MRIEETENKYIIKITPKGTGFVWEMKAPNGVDICYSKKTFKTSGLARESIRNWMDIIRERSIWIVEESVPLHPTKQLMGPPPS